MGQKLEVKVGSRRLRVQVGSHSEEALVAAADRANEVLGRLLAANKGSTDGGPARSWSKPSSPSALRTRIIGRRAEDD